MDYKKICIYHGNCADGFTAAWVVNKALGNDPNVEFFAGFYQNPPPDVTDKIVYIVDFSYKRAVMEELVSKAQMVVHIDHHATAIKDMEGFEASNFSSFYSVDNTESGALLTWKYFYPLLDAPALIKHVDDADRWKFLLPFTKQIQANIFSYEYTFDNWDMLMTQDIDKQIADGTAISRRYKKDGTELIGVVVRRMNIAGYNVPVANVPYQFGSDVCSKLAENEPFSAYYYDKEYGREFGLRSSESGLDVGKIAQIYGGGGHEHASGFRVSFDKAKEFEIQKDTHDKRNV